jgi:hypothetical protein
LISMQPIQTRTLIFLPPKLAPAAPPPPKTTPKQPGENRPHSPGGWVSEVGSHRRHASTLAVTSRRGGRGQSFRSLARFCLPRPLSLSVPSRVPRLTSKLLGTHRGRHRDNVRCSRVHVDAGRNSRHRLHICTDSCCLQRTSVRLLVGVDAQTDTADTRAPILAWARDR